MITLILLGCNNKFILQPINLQESDLPKECTGLIEEINTNWLKNNKANIYGLENKEFILKRLVFYYSVENKCITQLDTSQIVQLFGEPSNRKNHVYHYYFNEDCFNSYPSDCNYFEVYYDYNGQITKVDKGGISIMN